MKINEFDNSKDNVPITKKDAALYKQAQHMVMKSKVDYKPSVDTMVSVNKQMRDYVGNLDKDATKLSKAAGIPRDAVKPPKPLTQRSGNFSQFGKTENAVKEAGVGKIVKGVNTTPDVQPGETERQAKKLFPMNKGGKPKSLGVPGASPNVAFNLGLTEDELTTVQRAELFAQQAHKDHKRKYTGDPYYVHLDEVRRIVKGAGGSEDMQAAALLHDTVEDTSVTPQDIMKEFGPRIAKLVVELTDVSKPEDGNRAVRKGIDRDKLAGVSAEAQTIKYADLISNGKDIGVNDPKFAKVYHAEKADLLKVMTKGDSNLRSAALDMLPDELKENMSVTGTERRRLEKKKGLEIGSPEWFKHWFDLPYLREQEVNTTNPNTGVQTTVNKKANRITTRSDAGTVVKDRSGNIRSVSTPRVGGFQAKQTFRPDSTPGYGQANYKSGGIELDAKGSPETGYTNTARSSIGGLGVGVKQRYDGSQQATVDYNLGQGKKIGITQNIPKPKQKLNMSEGIQKVDVEQLEKFADRLFGKVGIDVEFTRHFMDRVNDVRNQKPITMSELTRLFKQEYKRWGKPIAQMGPNSQAVMKDLQTNINLPFVLKWDDKNNELDLIAKTVMRKQDFKTPNKEFPVENAPGSLAQKINWGSQNKPIKKNTSSGSSGNNQQLAWWQKIKQKVMGEDVEKLDLKKKFEITDELNKLSNIFNRGGHEIRIVGGAVRDLALDKTPKDIDLATDATPDEMQQMFDSAGVRHIPTGIEHGTITAVINGEEFEVTTLRADVETDGRRAEVEFVRSWEEDAKRRDLTYNAMSMDFEGNLYDYHGGMDDLQDKVTRFVGDPEERIKEDYLRTLRYFRFQGRLDTPTFDRETMQAIASNTDGLKKLSVERVWMEMGKILGGSNIQQILGAMQKTGVLGAIGLDVKPSQDIMDGGDSIINLARITDDESIGVRWKMSNEEKGKLGFLIQNKGKTYNKDWYTNMMVDGFDRTQLDALARYNNQDDMIAHIKSFKAPQFPVDGNDLIKMGHERGPKIGQTLNALRAQWKAGNFSASKDELLKTINEEGPFGMIARKASHVINKSQYEKAAKFLHNILQRKYQETGGKLRHTLGYYAQMIASQTGNKLNWRELQAEYLDQYGNVMFEKINKNTPMGDVIDDFQKSDAPQFKGKSQKKRRQMAIAAKLAKMDENKVQEAFDNPYPITWEYLKPTGASSAIGKVDDGSALDIHISEDPAGIYEIEFARGQSNKNMARTGQGDEFRIFATVQAAMLKWWEQLDKTSARKITFYANREDGNRARLYKRFLKMWGDKSEWDIEVNGNAKPGLVAYTLTNPNPNEPKNDKKTFMQRMFGEEETVENFADGKKPGRKGLSKRVGIPKGATLAQLEKIAKNSTGEKRRMAQWQLNMRRGKNKAK